MGIKSYYLIIAGITGLVMSAFVQAAPEVRPPSYNRLETEVRSAPSAVSFFSFYCPACYRYDQEMKVYEHVRKVLPAGEELFSYHVSGMGPLGKELTRAWAVATLLQVTEQVKGPLFKGIQQSRSINSAQEIRDVFISTGVRAQDYDSAWDSFAVTAHAQRQEQLAEALNVTGIPAMYIKGRYKVDASGFDRSSTDKFVSDYQKTVSFLMTAGDNS